MSVTGQRRAFLKEQCRLFAAGVIDEIEVIASGRFDHLDLSGEEMEILENEKHAIADRIWKVRPTPEPQTNMAGVPIDRDRAAKAAVEANTAYGQWMPERWLYLFLDAYEGKR